jgi:biopolymer transport protein ExbB
MRFFWLGLPVVGFLLFTGCLPDEKPSLSIDSFLVQLKELEIQAQPVPAASYPALAKALPAQNPLGVFRCNNSTFALYELRDQWNPAAIDDDNASLVYRVNLNLLLVADKGIDSPILDLFESLRAPLGYRQAGVFIYPLGLCMLLAVFVITERSYSLRRGLTFPRKVERALMSGEFPDNKWKKRSSAERIVFVAIHEKPSSESLRAYARLEIAAFEQGLFLLEVVVAGAPLIGLLGTVTGLVKVFSSMPSSMGGGGDFFSEGLALALLTTIIGLAIAIPALIGYSYLIRVVEKRTASIDWLTARLLDSVHPRHSSDSSQ